MLVQGNIPVLCLLGEHTGRLVDDQDILILVNNIKTGHPTASVRRFPPLIWDVCLYTGDGYPGKFSNGILCQKQPDLISLFEPLSSLASLSVQRNIFFTHHFI